MSGPVFYDVPTAPRPVAPFSHAVEADGWVVLTGQMPFPGLSPDEPYPDGIEAQTHRVMVNLGAVLRGIDLDYRAVVSARVYLVHFDDDYADMNRVYASYFAADRLPARTCVGVTALARGARVEIELVARRT